MNTHQKPLRMTWYKFLIYFALFAGATINTLYGFVFLTGGIYEVESQGQWTAEQIYSYYGEGLQILDIMRGLFMLGFSVFQIILRYKLAHFKPDAPKLLYINVALMTGGSFLYRILSACITGKFSASSVISFVGGILLLIFNIKYFEKRKHLFVENPTPQKSKPIIPSQAAPQIFAPSTQKNLHSSQMQQIKFCRRCGTTLYSDSDFCHVCGTKIYKPTPLETPPATQKEVYTPQPVTDSSPKSTCVRCGKEIARNAIYCEDCFYAITGTPNDKKPPICPKCQIELTETTRVCPVCRTSVK